eukprot:Sspe_Gene.88327::Locus_60362_Transcript_1_1_Confidence_1.000_Length_1176::g.88327::m.88327
MDQLVAEYCHRIEQLEQQVADAEEARREAEELAQRNAEDLEDERVYWREVRKHSSEPEKQELLKEREELLSLVASKDSELAEAHEKLADLREQIAEAHRAVSAVGEEIGAAERATHGQLADELSKEREMAESLHRRVEEMSAQRGEMFDTIRLQAESLKAKEAEIAQLTATLSRERERRTSDSGVTGELSRELEAARNDALHAQGEVSRLELELKKVRGQVTSLEAMLDKAQAARPGGDGEEVAEALPAVLEQLEDLRRENELMQINAKELIQQKTRTCELLRLDVSRLSNLVAELEAARRHAPMLPREDDQDRNAQIVKELEDQLRRLQDQQRTKEADHIREVRLLQREVEGHRDLQEEVEHLRMELEA